MAALHLSSTGHRTPPRNLRSAQPDTWVSNGEVRVLAKPGQAVLFDGCLYHRGGANQSQGARRACLMCYQPAWMKSREPFDGPFAQRIRAEGSDEQKMLLGAIEHW